MPQDTRFYRSIFDKAYQPGALPTYNSNNGLPSLPHAPCPHTHAGAHTHSYPHTDTCISTHTHIGTYSYVHTHRPTYTHM